MNIVYDLLEQLREELNNNVFINTVSFGDIDDPDLNKTTIFPLAHIILDRSRIVDNIVEFDIIIIIADIVDISNKKESGDEFYGNNNLQDVLNAMFIVAQRLHGNLFRGDRGNNNFRVFGDPIVEPFMDRYSNLLAGWEMRLTVQVPNLIRVDKEEGCS